MPPQDETLTRELAWLREFTPAPRRAAETLPSLEGQRVLAVCHLDLKMIPYFEALVASGAEVRACAANPATTRDEVAEHLGSLGVTVPARAFDPPERHAAHLWAAVSAGPTLLSEMGADASAATRGRLGGVRGGLEATGTGIERLAGLVLAYPVFNWDEVPIKQGLHNRHLVGLMAANTFLDVTASPSTARRCSSSGTAPSGGALQTPPEASAPWWKSATWTLAPGSPRPTSAL